MTERNLHDFIDKLFMQGKLRMLTVKVSPETITIDHKKFLGIKDKRFFLINEDFTKPLLFHI